MAFCSHCGINVSDGKTYCPYCGQSVKAHVYNNARGEKAYEGNGNAHTADWQDYNRYRDDGFSKRDVDENRIVAMLSYFNILLIIPLLLKPRSQYVRFHCNQGILLLLMTILISIISKSPFLGGLFGFVGSIFVFLCFAYGVLNALTGNARPLPIIGMFTIIK